MSTEEPKRVAFNPTWIAAAVLVLTELFRVGGNVQAFSDLRARQDADETWKAATDKRLSEGEKVAAVSSAKVEKDLETLKAGMNSLQSALMVPPVIRTTTPNSTRTP